MFVHDFFVFSIKISKKQHFDQETRKKNDFSLKTSLKFHQKYLSFQFTNTRQRRIQYGIRTIRTMHTRHSRAINFGLPKIAGHRCGQKEKEI